MFKFLFILILMPNIVLAGDIVLIWNASHESDIAGYEIGYRLQDNIEYTIIDVGNVTQYKIENLTDNVQYFFSARGYDRGGLKAEWGDEIDNIAPEKIDGFRIMTINNNGGVVNIN